MTLRVVDPGLYSLLVDFGRPRYRSLGVPVGGAADRSALAIGNALVGNPPNAAALEISLAGPTLQAGCELACVLHGAPFSLESDRQRLKPGTTFTLEPGEELRIGAPVLGMRAYLCVRGGFETKMILGSLSALEPLKAGVELRCTPGRIHARRLSPQWECDREADLPPNTFRIIDGPQAHWFPGTTFHSQEFTITPASNRMGLRLQSEPLILPARELLSESVCSGTVQVTRDGQCIILGVDGQTIGGYPKIAQIISVDLDRLGQLRPGERVRFLRTSLEEAERLFRRRERELHEWVTRLRTAEIFPVSRPTHQDNRA